MRRLAFIALITMLADPSPLLAQSPPPQPPPTPSSQAPAPRGQTASIAVPVYKPPLRGAPGGRIGGGTRGVPGETLALSVLAPDDRALTISEQPTLYWFISSRTSFPIEVVLMDPDGIRPMLELNLAPPTQAGVHPIRLADHGIRIQPGIAYRWYVAVVPDAGRRSRDILAGGTIERIMPPPDLTSTLSRSGRDDRVSLYASAGLWYDALTEVTDLVDQSPGDSALRQQRAALLKQVGLPDIGDR
jgi:hypothetical protein